MFNLDVLAEATEGFSAADIRGICDEVKYQLLLRRLEGREGDMTTEEVLKIIKARKPSITKEMLKSYQKFLETYGERK